MSDVLLGVIIGSVLSIAAGVLTELVRNNRESRLDREKRADNRQLAREEFQRGTLVQLQDTLIEWARTGQEHLMADLRAFRATGEWGRNLVGEDLSARELAANRRLTLLRSHVFDHELRARIGRCHDLGYQMAMAKDEASARQASYDLASEVDWCLTRSGELIRELWQR